MLCFAAARADDQLTIDLFDVIGADFWGEGITAKSISRVLTINGDAKDILVRINSPGGDVFEGIAIFGLLRAHPAKVRVQIIGLAASMASVLALAGDTVEMGASAMFMIHDPWAFAIGSGDDMRKTAEMLDRVKDNLLHVYVAASTLERDELSKLMSAETWMTAAEAKAVGFVDEIIAVVDAPETGADAEAAARARSVLDKFQHAPAGVQHRYKAPLIAAMAQPKGTKMDRDKIIAALGLPTDATDEQIDAALAGKRPAAEQAPTLRDVVPRADFDALRTENARLRADQEAKARADFEAQVQAAVAAAIAAGKIKPASRDYHMKMIHARKSEGLADFAEYVASEPELVGNAQMERAEARDVRGGAAGTSVTTEERAICKALGITPEQMAATRKEIAEDPETYPPEAYRFAI